MIQEEQEINIGVLEREFLSHNIRMNRIYKKNLLTVIPFHIAVKLVEEGIWERKRNCFLVLLPNGKTS